MLYSCFDPARGIYDYYESKSVQIPINADLPVPSFPPAGNDIGVPSIIAGRPMPSDARHVGEGWHARGMVARCGGGFSGLGDWLDLSDTAYKAVMVGTLALVAYGAWSLVTTPRGRR